MGAQENKQSAQDAYAAFGEGDAEGAMRNIDDSVEWTVAMERGTRAMRAAGLDPLVVVAARVW